MWPGLLGEPYCLVLEPVGLDTFFSVFSDDRSVFDSSLETIERRWRDGHAIMLLELASFLPRDRGEKIVDVLRKQAGGTAKSHDDLFHWVWKIAPKQHPEYARFKEVLYSQIDSRFAAYFDNSTESARIRLDEVRWGGVKRDGIPPLKNPKMISPNDASYLKDDMSSSALRSTATLALTRNESSPGTRCLRTGWRVGQRRLLHPVRLDDLIH